MEEAYSHVLQSLKSGKDVKAMYVTNRRTMGQEDMIQEQPTEASTPAAVHEGPEVTDGSKGSSERIFCLIGVTATILNLLVVVLVYIYTPV